MCPHGRSTVVSTSTTFRSLVNPRRWKPIPNALPGPAAALRPLPPTSGPDRISQTGGGLGGHIGASQPHHGQTLRVAPRGSAPWYHCARLGVPRGCTSNAPSGNNRLSIFNIPCSAAPRDPLREAGRGDGRCVRCGGHCRRKSDGSGGSPAHSPPSWLRECAAGLLEPVLRSHLPSPARARQRTGTALSPWCCVADGEERSVSYALRERGFAVHVMPLQRIQWLNVLRGLISLNFWLRRQAAPRPRRLRPAPA